MASQLSPLTRHTANPLRPTALRTRAICSADRAFALALIECTLRQWIERDLGRWNAAAMERHIGMRCAEGRWRVLMVRGERVGVIALEEATRQLMLEQLFIEPSWQRRGIGRHLIHSCQARATRSAKPLRLSVLHSNPARRFYRDCGFVEESRTGATHKLAWYPR